MLIQNKVRLTVECSADERMYVKMLAAKKRMTISEFLLSPARASIPDICKKEPSTETVKALKESRKNNLQGYKTMDNFWEAMGIDPNA